MAREFITEIFFQKYAMQQAMKTLTGQMSSGTRSSPFNNSTFSQGSQFPFQFSMPPPPTSGTSTTPVASPPSRPRVTVDVSATDVEAAPHSSPAEVKQETEIKKEQQKYGLVYKAIWCNMPGPLCKPVQSY
ncbi:hypothetical protein C5167_013430 [Papaver somniferum]|uniref:Uncharacterized protein n=1 Tax=Papaver somniferum TaxID=3469 RepID=A0A4Y7J3R3_PAPSO|nr:hypothetical protein C5167_013430 [Papaver somniferum]